MAHPKVSQRGFEHFQPHQVTKAAPGCQGGKESQEDTGHPDFTEESLGEMGSQGCRAPQAPRAHLG